MADYQEELTIDIKDMLHRLLKKWKPVVLCALALALILGAFSAYKEQNKRAGTFAFMQNHPEANYSYAAADKAKTLSAPSIESVESAVEQNSAYRAQIKDIQNYLSDSIACNLSTDKVPTATTTYLIGVKSDSWQYMTSARAANDIVLAYRACILSDEVLQPIIDDLGLETDCRYLKEVVSIGQNSDSARQEPAQENNLLVVTVFGDSLDTCQAVSSKLSSAIEKMTPSIQKSLEGYDFTLSLINTKLEETDARWVGENINAAYKAITDLNNNIANISKNMSADEKALYDELVSERQLSENGDAEQLAQLGKPAGSLLNKKMIAIGFVLGAFLACAWICGKYILSNRLRVADDLHDVFALYNLETVENAKAIAAKKKVKNICVLGAAKDSIGIPSADITEADAAILAEQIDVSLYDAIAREVETCAQYELPILGYIVK